MYFCYMRNNKSVLWLTGWYPSSTHPDAGNFIVRHANAFVQSQVNREQSLGLVVAHFPVYSFWRMLKYGKALVKPKPEGHLMSGAELLWSPVPQFGGGLLGRWVSYQYYKWRVVRVLRQWVADNGLPLGVHVHAADKVMRVVPGFWIIVWRRLVSDCPCGILNIGPYLTRWFLMDSANAMRCLKVI